MWCSLLSSALCILYARGVRIANVPNKISIASTSSAIWCIHSLCVSLMDITTPVWMASRYVMYAWCIWSTKSWHYSWWKINCLAMPARWKLHLQSVIAHRMLCSVAKTIEQTTITTFEMRIYSPFEQIFTAPIIQYFKMHITTGHLDFCWCRLMLVVLSDHHWSAHYSTHTHTHRHQF